MASTPTSHVAGHIEPLRREATVREKIRETLRAALISGALEPGRIYSAPQLAGQLGVSPAAVRDELIALADAGLFEVLRNRGFRVVHVTGQELDKIFEVRVLLEVPATGRAAEIGLGDARTEMEDLCTSIELSASEGRITDFLDADKRFHLIITGAGGNDRLVKIVQDLRETTRLFSLERLARQHQLVDSAAEHRELLHLIDVGDAEASKALMHKHLLHTRGIWAT